MWFMQRICPNLVNYEIQKDKSTVLNGFNIVKQITPTCIFKMESNMKNISNYDVQYLHLTNYDADDHLSLVI